MLGIDKIERHRERIGIGADCRKESVVQGARETTLTGDAGEGTRKLRIWLRREIQVAVYNASQRVSAAVDSDLSCGVVFNVGTGLSKVETILSVKRERRRSLRVRRSHSERAEITVRIEHQRRISISR